MRNAITWYPTDLWYFHFTLRAAGTCRWGWWRSWSCGLLNKRKRRYTAHYFLEMHKTKTKEITPANRSIRKLNNAMPTSPASKKQVRDWFQLNKRVQPGAPNEKKNTWNIIFCILRLFQSFFIKAYLFKLIQVDLFGVFSWKFRPQKVLGNRILPVKFPSYWWLSESASWPNFAL